MQVEFYLPKSEEKELRYWKFELDVLPDVGQMITISAENSYEGYFDVVTCTVVEIEHILTTEPIKEFGFKRPRHQILIELKRFEDAS